MADSGNRPISQAQLPGADVPSLMAIVQVDKAERVYCAQPGCHHTVYKAIHVVKEGDHLLVLGSTCFQKRYGSLNALGKAQHRAGNGRALTTEERGLLMENTQALLARFEVEEVRMREDARQKLHRLREEMLRRATAKQVSTPTAVQRPGMLGMSLRGVFPWPWMMPASSVAAFKLRDGSGWVRVEHKDRRQFIVPWPRFDGWEEALPLGVGDANLEVGGYEVVGPLVASIAYLRAHAVGEKITGLWGDVAALLDDKSTRL